MVFVAKFLLVNAEELCMFNKLLINRLEKLSIRVSNLVVGQPPRFQDSFGCVLEAPDWAGDWAEEL